MINFYGSYEQAAKFEQGREALIAYGKIPQRDEQKRLTALEAVIKQLNGGKEITDGYKHVATTEEGRETLIAYGKIPNNTEDQIKALEAVIDSCAKKVKDEKPEMKRKTDYEAAAEKEQGREAMFVHISIPLTGRDNDKQYDIAIALMDAITGQSFKSLKSSAEEQKKYLLQVNEDFFGRKVLEKFRFKCRGKDEEKIVSEVLSTGREGYAERDRGAVRGGCAKRGRGMFRSTFDEKRKVNRRKAVDEPGRGRGGFSMRGLGGFSPRGRGRK